MLERLMNLPTFVLCVNRLETTEIAEAEAKGSPQGITKPIYSISPMAI